MHRPLVSFVVFLVVVSAVLGGVHYYVWHRLVRAPALAAPWYGVASYAIAALAVLTPVGLVASRALERPASTVVAVVVYGWMGLVALLFFFFLGAEIIRSSVHVYYALVASPFDAARRTFLSRAIAGVVGFSAVGLAGVGAATALGEVTTQRVRVRLARLPASIAGFRIVQITDLHIGPTLGHKWLEQVVAQVNALAPDLVAITGDLVDGSVEALRDQTAPLAALRAKHGVFFVTGNHEYYSGADAWIAELGRLGVRVLRNERVAIGEGEASFDLAGVDDYSAHRFGRGHGADLARAVAGRDTGRELVLLAHQPKQIHDAVKHGVGLQLSGHTHGGQFFPWHLFVRLDQPFLSGLGRLGDTQIYVSRGTGYWGPPIRIAAPPEISVIELARA
jgi:predicted MPP superfamily phosphohydrolase